MHPRFVLGLLLALASCARTEPFSPADATPTDAGPGAPTLILESTNGSTLRDDGMLTLIAVATDGAGHFGQGSVLFTASRGQFPTSGRSAMAVPLVNGVALAPYACDGRSDACSADSITFTAQWDGLTASLVVAVEHLRRPDAGDPDAGAPDAGPPVLELQAAPGAVLRDDGSAIALISTATTAARLEGQGTVTLTAAHGQFAASGRSTVDVVLQNGAATAAYACDAHVDPACHSPQLSFAAQWSGVAAALTLPVTHVDTTGTCDATCQQIAPSLSGLQWDLPCSTAATSFSCFLSPAPPLTTTLHGEPGALYDVGLRFRGVVEQRGYMGGTNDGAFWQIGGTPGPDQYNTIRFAISDPPQTYYVNRGTSLLQYCFPIDYTKTVQVATDATITLSFQDTDSQEIDNIDSNGQPISVPGLPGQPYNGQFVQIDVVSATQAN